MKSLLKKSVFIGALACLSFVNNAFAANDPSEMPVILSIKTNIFQYQGPDNNFTLYLGSTVKDSEFFVTTGKSSEYVWVDPWTVGTDSEGNNAVIATAVPLSVTETDNTVEIRGDASLLDYIDLHGCYISQVDFPGDFSNLTVIDLSYNEISYINLEKFVALQSIDLTANEFTNPNNMIIGTNHPDLDILSVGINDVIDPNFELKNFPKLRYFSARNNYGVTSIDPTENPELVSLVLEVTNISSIDVSKNTKLDVLNLSNTKVTDIDISKNTILGEFYASHEGSYNSENKYKLTSIDVSNNTTLQYLDLGGNNLSEIDLSNNPDLILLYLQRNRLTHLDLSNCKKLASVNLSNNLFTFSTLPLPQPGWDYMYFRSPLPCNFKYKVGETIDFASSVIVEPFTDDSGNLISPITDATVFIAPLLSEEIQVDPASGIYTYADGKITFHTAISDSVYIKFSNSVFYDWDLDTEKFMVKTEEDFNKPSTLFTFTPYSSMKGKDVGFKIGVTPIASGVSLPANVTVSVDGETVATLSVTSTALPEADNVVFTVPEKGGKISMFVEDGFGLSALEMDNIKMSAIDLSNAFDLSSLTLTNANLTNIDLGYNRALRSVNLSHNLLGSIDFTPVRGDFEKWNLREINVSFNELTSISAQNSVQFTHLDLSNNWFTGIDLGYYEALTYLDLSNNGITGELDLKANRALQTLNLSDNEIESVLISEIAPISNINLSNNRLSFTTLPTPGSYSGTLYLYAPQKPYSILPKGAAVNLSDQNINNETTFTWKYVSDGEIVPAELIETNEGIARFSDTLIGTSLYCEMTNPAFPDFNSQPLTTSVIEVMGRPTNVVASFTPAQSGKITIGFAFNKPGANAVYVDWSGNGSQYDEYIYDSQNTAIYRTGEAVKNATAVVYTYGDPSDVSMIFINNAGIDGSTIPLKDFDATPMTKAESFNIHNAALTDGSIKLPASPKIYELVFDGNNFTNQVFKGVGDFEYTSLRNLNLGNNKYITFDLTQYPKVTFLTLSDNQLVSVTPAVNNNSLFQLSLNNNNLTSINLSGLNALSELILSDNNLSSIDITPIKSTIKALLIAGNRMTFKTLPKYNDFNPEIFFYYDYANQRPIAVTCEDGEVDLTDQYEVTYLTAQPDGPYSESTAYTNYRWFIGDKQSDVYYDYNTEMFVGEELEGPQANPDDPEYIVDNGITKFLYSQKRGVIGAMTNDGLPGLILYTTPFYVELTGVEDVTADAENRPVDVYTLSGVRIRSNVEPGKALEGLSTGVYIVGNKKVYIK